MSVLPLAFLVRHGETVWSLSGQHTGRTDLPLTLGGEANARRLGERLLGNQFALVLTSPLQRAVRTCELAGFGGVVEPDVDLVEWDYGRYEGKTTAEIRAENPTWDLFHEGCPNGESPTAVAHRADRIVARVRMASGNVLLFSSGHFLRVLAARWCGLDVTFARYLLLDTGTVSVLGYAHNDLREPALKFWNQST
jgi:broad specificity phosphatase PhoE